MGCHDIGEFVRHYPRGRQVLDKIAAKQTVMQLMTNDVSYYLQKDVGWPVTLRHGFSIETNNIAP